MLEVFKWFLENWRIVLEVVLLIVSVIILIVKKKPVNAIAESIVMSCLQAVMYVERLPNLKGKQKLDEAIQFVNVDLHNLYPDLDITKYKNAIVSCIELILQTPQKKGD